MKRPLLGCMIFIHMASCVSLSGRPLQEVKEKTTGDGWFNMKAPELTPELRADLKVIKMRGAMDPKRFYKKSDREGLPKYFQVGSPPVLLHF